MSDNIPNCEYTGDPDAKSEIRLWYKCPKCNKKIWNHLYNEHVHNCSRAKALLERALKEQPRKSNKPLEKKRLVVRSAIGSTASRHRKRPPVNR